MDLSYRLFSPVPPPASVFASEGVRCPLEGSSFACSHPPPRHLLIRSYLLLESQGSRCRRGWWEEAEGQVGAGASGAWEAVRPTAGQEDPASVC